MSHFYASIHESTRRTPATAKGHKSTGLKLWAGSYAGVISLEIWHDKATGEDRFIITHQDHPKNKGAHRKELANGSLD